MSDTVFVKENVFLFEDSYLDTDSKILKASEM